MIALTELGHGRDFTVGPAADEIARRLAEKGYRIVKVADAR